MPAKLYHVNLTVEERQELLELTSKGRINARKMKRAQVLLKADEGLKDEDIMAAVGVSRPMVERTRKRLVEGGLNKALNEDPRPGAKRRLDGRAEAHLIALTCSESPDDHDHWTLRLLARRRNLEVTGTSSGLANKLVELGVVESVSYETVRQTLKKMS